LSLSIETCRQRGREAVIALHGEVDYITALELRGTISAVLGAGDVDMIIVNMAGVTFLDSTGVGTIVVAARICADMRVGFRVTEANPFIVKLFTVVGVAEMLGVPVEPEVSPQVAKPRARSSASRVA
jgi:anti-anti-sigma factor